MSIKLKIRKALAYFSPIDLIMWGSSVTLIIASFLLFSGSDILTLAASLIGVTSLIFAAKGNPLGQLLMGRDAVHHEEDHIEPKSVPRAAGHIQMSVVDGVKAAPQNTDLHVL